MPVARYSHRYNALQQRSAAALRSSIDSAREPSRQATATGERMRKRQFSHRRGSKLYRRRVHRLERLETRRLLANVAPVVARPIPDLTIQAGLPFQFDARPNGAVVLGFDAGGNNARVTDNVFAGSIIFKEDWDDVVVTGNTIINEAPFRVASLDDSPEANHGDFIWNRNSYITNSARPFSFAGSTGSFDQWQRKTGFDEDSLLSHKAVGTEVMIRPNRYRPGRGHIAVYNWQHHDQIAVDLGEILKPGQSFEVFHVLDLDGDPVVRGRYDGGLVTLPLESMEAPVPLGHQPSAPLVMTNEFAAFVVVSGSAELPVSGRQWFVAPGGSPRGDGSADRPWDIHSALSHPREVQPGDTIWLRGGTYVGPFRSDLAGTAAAPIEVRSFPGERAVIDLFNGSPEDYPVVTIEGRYAHFEDIEIFSSSPASRTTTQPGSWPDDITRGNINIYGDHIKFINMEIHDLNKGLGFWESAEGGEIYGSLLYNNGWIGPDRRHGHAIYSQNEGETRRFTDNITFNQFRHGIKIYGSSAASLDNHHLEGNISFNNGAAEGAGFSGNYQILIGGGQVVRNTTVHENYTYVSGHHFVDADVNNGMVYTAQQSNGDPLPDWLSFYATEGFFAGTPSDGDIGAIEIELTATDRQGASVAETFRLEVQPRNRAPQATGELSDQSFHRDQPVVIDAAAGFIDPDAADALMYSIASATDQPLPDWLSIDRHTGRIEGLSSEAGSHAVTVFAFDPQGEFAAQTLTLTVLAASIDTPNPLLSYSGSGSLTLGLDPQGTSIQLRHGEQTVASQPLSQTESVRLAGAVETWDTLTIDFSHGNPIPAGGLDWAGGGTVATDSLILIHGEFDALELGLNTASETGMITLQADGHSAEVRFTAVGPTWALVQHDAATIRLEGDQNFSTLSTPGPGLTALSRGPHQEITIATPRRSLVVAATGPRDTVVLQEVADLAGTDLHIDSYMVVATGAVHTGGGNLTIAATLFGTTEGATIHTAGGNVELATEWGLLGASVVTGGGSLLARGSKSLVVWNPQAVIDTRVSSQAGSQDAGAVRIEFAEDVVLGTLWAGTEVELWAGRRLDVEQPLSGP